MDEKDKMLRQMVYNANDAVLNEDRMKCKDLCYEFNIVKPSQTKRIHIPPCFLPTSVKKRC